MVQGKLHCYYFCCVVLCYVAHVCVVTAVSIYGLIGPLSRLTLLFDFWNAEILCEKNCVVFLSSRIAPDDIFGSFFFKYYNEILCGG